MLYFDTHAHYDFKEFDNDRDKLMEELNDSLIAIVNIGINPSSCKRVLEYSKKYKLCFSSLGIHPQEVSNLISIDEIYNIYNKSEIKEKIVAIGETGLDYHYDYPKELQKEYFLKHIYLANELKLPIIIHARDSHKDILEILSNNMVYKKGIMHCYSGPSEMVNEFLKLGFYISFSGALTRYHDVQESLKLVPLNRILIETDAPLLTPLPFSKKTRNDSRNLEIIIDSIAKLKNISTDEVINITIENACRIYNIDKNKF